MTSNLRINQLAEALSMNPLEAAALIGNCLCEESKEVPAEADTAERLANENREPARKRKLP